MNAYQVISERIARSGIEHQVKAIAGGAVFLVRRGEQKRAFHVNDVVNRIALVLLPGELEAWAAAEQLPRTALKRQKGAIYWGFVVNTSSLLRR
jgi:hypothetical protein